MMHLTITVVSTLSALLEKQGNHLTVQKIQDHSEQLMEKVYLLLRDQIRNKNNIP